MSNDILEQVEILLTNYYETPDVAKAIIYHPVKATCLADIIFASLFFANHAVKFTPDPYTLDCLIERVPLLVAHKYTGFYAFGADELAGRMQESLQQPVHTSVQVLHDEEMVVERLADAIQHDPELILMCWNLAEQIAATAFWQPGDFVYDCMVRLGILPLYDDYEEPYTEEEEDAD